MKTKREQWKYEGKCKVWVGKYKNSHNMPHWHYDCELLYVEKGNLDIFCNQKAYSISEGQSFFIDSEQVHHMQATDPETIISIAVFDYNIIKPFAEKLTLRSPTLSYGGGERTDRVWQLFDDLRELFKERRKYYEFETSALISLFMIDVFRNEETVAKEENPRTVAMFKLLLSDIDEKYEFYDFKTAVDFMCMTPEYFSRLFHKLTGVTFTKYLNLVKCENAIHILKTEQTISITELSIRCGFSTIRNFNRIFKEITGFTPRSLPKDFILKRDFSNLNELAADPTNVGCKLIESSY